jgi:hypothetical protein
VLSQTTLPALLGDLEQIPFAVLDPVPTRPSSHGAPVTSVTA